jgi:hypothetical protein
VPLSEALEVSGVEYVFAASHAAMPEVASVPAKVTASPWLYQPLSSVGRAGDAVACGAVASYLRGNDALRTFPAWSVQLPPRAAAPLSGPE